MSDQWGVGDQADAKAFDATYVGDTKVELITGQHPHSRSDNSHYARYPDGRIEEFDGHRLLHEIKFRDYNYLKESGLSGNQVRKGGECEIIINGNVVESFFYRDVQEALLVARQKLQRVYDHPIRLWDDAEIAQLPGRKVYYRGVPAVIESYLEDQACVMIQSEAGTKGFPAAPYELEDFKENSGYGLPSETRIKDTIYSPHIWWYRK